MELQESGQMYLETIYILSHSLPVVRSLDVAEYMKYSQPSVCRAMGILKKGEYIIMDRDGYITLTETGRALASKIYERHTLLTDLLIYIGVDQETAAADACKIEHDISDKTFAVLKSYLQTHQI